MKSKALAFGIPLALAMFASSVFAQSPKKKGTERCMPAHIKRQLPTFDRNNNGKLEREERRALRRAERRADLARFDADGDGSLSKKERATLWNKKTRERFRDLDKNGDSSLSAAEVSGSCTPAENHFGRIDSDKSGSISWAEFSSASEKFRLRRQARRPGARSPDASKKKSR